MCVVEAGVVTEFDLMFYVIKCSTFETNSFWITGLITLVLYSVNTNVPWN